MNEEMIRRVMDKLRVCRPYDDDELLRALATQTTLGFAIAWRLTLEDLGKTMLAEWETTLRRFHLT